jgi:hypothetical protein
VHTSTRLQSTDFQFWQWRQGQLAAAHFDAFCPNYHELDRVGVVSPCLEDGVLHTAYALLALTTAFYDTQRAHTTDFFTYPQHFAFVGAGAAGVYTHGDPLPLARPKLWNAWSWLDVWPDNKWITAPPTATGMLKQIFDYQINRLFWPSDLKPGPNENPLPGYAAKMLKTSLKAVYYYRCAGLADATPADSALEIQANAAGAMLRQESIAQLPNASGLPLHQDPPTNERYQLVRVSDFLDEMCGCFSSLQPL